MRRETLRRLLASYWQPIYGAVRFGWELDPETARVRVQELFHELLQRDTLSELDPGDGRFREFLKVRLEEFMERVGREPGEAPRETTVADLTQADSLDVEPGEPARVFDRCWLEMLLERALERFSAHGEVEDRPLYEVFRQVDVEGEKDLEAVARRLELGPQEARQLLFQARKHFRRLVAEQIQDYALDDADAREELRWTIG